MRYGKISLRNSLLLIICTNFNESTSPKHNILAMLCVGEEDLQFPSQPGLILSRLIETR